MSAVTREWIEAGYFVISGKTPEKQQRFLPGKVVTVSECVVDTHPDFLALPWIDPASDDLREVRALLALDDSELSDMRSWVARALDDGRFGWPNVFFSLETAREFRQRFLGAARESRIVSLHLAKDLTADFLQDEAPQEGREGPGIWTMVARGVPSNPRARRMLFRRRGTQHGSPLGFDVLGAEVGGSFHTFSCNGLEQAFHEKLGITFNEHGLIDDYSKAVEACAYANRDDVGAEPVPWYPFRVDDHAVMEAC